MSSSTRDVITALYTAFGAQDLPGILALLHPDVEWVCHVANPPAGPGGVRRGHEGAADFFREVGTAEDIHEFVIDLMAVDGEAVVVRGHERVTHRGTGKSWESPWIHWWTVREGLVVKYEGFIDSAKVEAAYTP